MRLYRHGLAQRGLCHNIMWLLANLIHYKLSDTCIVTYIKLFILENINTLICLQALPLPLNDSTHRKNCQYFEID